MPQSFAGKNGGARVPLPDTWLDACRQTYARKPRRRPAIAFGFRWLCTAPSGKRQNSAKAKAYPPEGHMKMLLSSDGWPQKMPGRHCAFRPFRAPPPVFSFVHDRGTPPLPDTICEYPYRLIRIPQLRIPISDGPPTPVLSSPPLAPHFARICTQVYTYSHKIII